MFVSHFWLFLYLGLMILSGIFVNGPYGLITTAVSANLVSCAFLFLMILIYTLQNYHWNVLKTIQNIYFKKQTKNMYIDIDRRKFTNLSFVIV